MPSEKIQAILEAGNIADLLDDDVLNAIGDKVVRGYEYDSASRAEWFADVEAAIDMAKLKKQSKDFPWKNAANIRMPIIATAATQFAARTYPEIVKNGRVVHYATVGKEKAEQPVPPQQPMPQQGGQPPIAPPQPVVGGAKEQRAKRVARFTNWQLLVETNDWEISTDKLLTVLPIVGTVFRKTYFNMSKLRIVSEFCLPNEIVLHNNVESLESARRVSHVLTRNKNDILGDMRAGIYKEYTTEELQLFETEDFELEDHKLIEQHCFFDLDDDGYEEPYIVTVHQETLKVLRIVARFDPDGVAYNDKNQIISIEPVHYFTDYHFLPNPDGSYYSMGFGTLLLSLNRTVNSVTNMLLNAGALASLQGGFIGKGLKARGGDFNLKPGQWQPIDSFGGNIKENIVPISYKEPSTVLFQLLGFMMEHIDRLTSVTEALSGTERAQNAPATTILSLIEQGLKVFTAIMRRQYWSFKKEFTKIHRLNRIYLSPEKYANVVDEEIEVVANEQGIPVITDFEETSFDIAPVADPNISSDAQRGARVDYLIKLLDQPQFGGLVNPAMVLQYAIQSADIPNPESFIQAPPPPTPPIELLQLQLDGHKMEMDKEQQFKEFQRQSVLDQATIDLYQGQIRQYEATAAKMMAEVNNITDEAGIKKIQLQLQEISEANKKATEDNQHIREMLNLLQEGGLQRAKLENERMAIQRDNEEASELPEGAQE